MEIIEQPARKKVTKTQIVLGIIGVVFIFCCICPIMFSVVGQAIGLVPTPTYAAPTATRFTLDESNAIQTQAVATYKAANPTQLSTRTPLPLPTNPPALATETPGIPPTETPIPLPTADESIGAVGQRVELGGIALTVTDVYKTESVIEYLQPDPGNVYLVVEVIIENISRSGETPYNPLYFSVKDEDGYQYNSTLFAPGTPLHAGTLQIGDKARGTLAFEIKSTTRGFVLTYQPLVILGGYVPIRILLGD